MVALDGKVDTRKPFTRTDTIMDLNDFLGPKPIVIDLRAENRWAAIDELINHLEASHKIKPEHIVAISERVKKCETSMGTAIGFGIGLPDASSDLITEPVGGIGRSREGIQFDALDGKPVNLVMFFAIPQRQFQKPLHTLANIAKLLHKSDFRTGL